MTNTDGQLPGAACADWLYTKVFTHPERLDELISAHLPRLLARLDNDPPYWFIRYRDLSDTDHLRLRIRTLDSDRAAVYVTEVAQWAQELRDAGLAGRLVFDTYYPETGRYGHGPVMRAAEAVFAADSKVVIAGLRHMPTALDSMALAAMNLVDIACALHGNTPEAMEWFTARPAPAAAPVDRAVVDQVAELVGRQVPHQRFDWPEPVAMALQDRAAALAVYRASLPAAGLDDVLESLLHMHHNRARGIAPDGERTCRRLARQAAITWRAQQGASR